VKWAALCATLSACAVTVKEPGCLCDEAHPCRSDESCIDGLCVDPVSGRACSAIDAGSDGGPACPDAGSGVIWSQCEHGFHTLHTTDAGTLQLGAQNRVTASLEPVATAMFDGPHGEEDRMRGLLPTMLPEGTLRGRLTLHALPASIVSCVSFGAGSASHIDLFVQPGSDGKHRLGLWCGNSTLFRTTVIAPAVPGPPKNLVLAGVPYEVQIRWRAGEYCQLEVDHLLAARYSGDGGVGSALPTTAELRVGIIDQDPTDAGPLVPTSVTLEHWRLAPVSVDL
jgi:hypothetical protein